MIPFVGNIFRMNKWDILQIVTFGVHPYSPDPDDYPDEEILNYPFKRIGKDKKWSNNPNSKKAALLYNDCKLSMELDQLRIDRYNGVKEEYLPESIKLLKKKYHTPS